MEHSWHSLHLRFLFGKEKVQKKKLSSWLNESKRGVHFVMTLYHWPEVKQTPNSFRQLFIHVGTHKLSHLFMCIITIFILACMGPCANHMKSKDKNLICDCTKFVFLCGKLYCRQIIIPKQLSNTLEIKVVWRQGWFRVWARKSLA